MADQVPGNDRKKPPARGLARLGGAALGDVGRVLGLLWFMCALGLVSLAFPAFSSPNPWRVLAVGFFLAGASTLVGSAIGFLFGVPQRRSGADKKASYLPNTNLERVSDWLTKILIGAGLTQASAIVDLLVRLSQFAGPVFGDAPLGATIAGAVIVHYLLIGFFQGFLLAYLWLPKAFKRAFPEQQGAAPVGEASNDGP